MEIRDIIAIVLSSTLLTTIITVVFNLLMSKRKDSIENITKERKEWREQLRSISKAITKSKNINQLYIAISELKVRINAYGIAENSIFYDSHLWKKIKEIEIKSTSTDDEIKNMKIYFVNQISCLLKYDWERSKAEIKGNTQTKVVIISLIVSFFLYSMRWFYYYSIGSGKISNYLSYCVLYVLVVAFSVLVIYFADKWKNSAAFYGYITFSILGGILLFSFVFGSIPSVRSSYIIDCIINFSPYVTLLYCAEIKLLYYRKNTSNFILTSIISSGGNVIDKKYRIFFRNKKFQNICTGEIITFID